MTLPETNYDKQIKKYLENIGYDTDEYTIVSWPDSQEYIGKDDCELIVDDEGLSIFGGSSYIVPVYYFEN